MLASLMLTFPELYYALKCEKDIYLTDDQVRILGLAAIQTLLFSKLLPLKNALQLTNQQERVLTVFVDYVKSDPRLIETILDFDDKQLKYFADRYLLVEDTNKMEKLTEIISLKNLLPLNERGWDKVLKNYDALVSKRLDPTRLDLTHMDRSASKSSLRALAYSDFWDKLGSDTGRSAEEKTSRREDSSSIDLVKGPEKADTPPAASSINPPKSKK